MVNLSNMMGQMATLIVTVRRNMLSSFVTTFFILAIIIVWSARGNIASWIERNPTPPQAQERFQKEGEINHKIERKLRGVLKATNADRIVVRQFSEHYDANTGQKFAYANITYLVAGPGVSTTGNAVTINMPRAYMQVLLDPMFADPANPVCVRRLTYRVKSEAYREILEKAGVKLFYVCPIRDLDGQPIGVLFSHYMTDNKERPFDEEIQKIMLKTTVEIAGYITVITKPEANSWMVRILKM